MREIKFRIWDIHSHLKCYSNQYSLYCANGVISNGVHVDGEKKRYIAQQFTGLYDKNGKEIYEGDILKWHEGDHELSEVVFQNGSFFVKGVNWGALWYIGDYNDSYEIVGNVFETPELLK